MEYLNVLATRFEVILRAHSVPFWIHLYRRIGVSLSPDHDAKTDAQTLMLVRSILELAIIKFGDLTNNIRDTARTSEIHTKDMLGGHFQRFWDKQFKGKPQQKRAFFAKILGTNQWVLTTFGLSDFLHIYELEGLAYEYWRATAWMRALGKGVTFIFKDTDDWPQPARMGPLAGLIRSYDRRIEEVPFSSSLIGSWFEPSGDEPQLRGGELFLPIYNVKNTTARYAFDMFGIDLTTPTAEPFKPNFLLARFNLQHFRRAHVFIAEEFRKLYGCSFDGFLMCLWGLCNIATIPSTVLQAFEAGKDSGEAAFAHATINLLQRGYLIFAGEEAELVDEILLRLSSYESEKGNWARQDVEIALNHLTLSDNRRDQIGLWSGGRRFALIPVNGGNLIDLQGIPSVLSSLFYRLQYQQTERGLIFEEAVRQAIKRAGLSLDRFGKIHTKAGLEREIDASVRIGDELILIECRTIERPLDYEIGRPRTLTARQDFLEQKIDQVITLREFIIAEPQGRDYDFTWAKKVEAFVVSPFVEWIWDVGDRFWISNDVPRILQANEALAWLQERAGT
jgi:hypothetical protein